MSVSAVTQAARSRSSSRRLAKRLLCCGSDGGINENRRGDRAGGRRQAGPDLRAIDRELATSTRPIDGLKLNNIGDTMAVADGDPDGWVVEFQGVAKTDVPAISGVCGKNETDRGGHGWRGRRG